MIYHWLNGGMLIYCLAEPMKTMTGYYLWNRSTEKSLTLLNIHYQLNQQVLQFTQLIYEIQKYIMFIYTAQEYSYFVHSLHSNCTCSFVIGQPNKPILPPVILTKNERKKIRKQRRREAELEKQEKIRFGFMDKPEPKRKCLYIQRSPIISFST